MAIRREIPNPLVGAVVHDHFDGSAHCVECDGDCRLIGSDLLATKLVRNWMEYVALQPKWWMPPGFESALEDAGVNVPQLKNRAIQSMKPYRRRA